MTGYTHELDVARQAARNAARLCMSVRREMLGSREAMEKAGREPVTIADYGAQAVILRDIAMRFPDDAVVAEERASEFSSVATAAQRERVLNHVREVIESTVSLDDIERWLDFGRGQRAARVWTVDPIDGTKGFIRGEQFAIAIGLLFGGELALGVLACPMLSYDPTHIDEVHGALAYAVRGGGGMIETLDGRDSRALRVSRMDRARDARVVESVESGHTDHDFSAGVLADAGVGGVPLRMDSQAKYVAVGDSRAEIYIRHSQGEGYQEKIWDHAAGALIVAEAGGRVTDLQGKPLDFSIGDRLAGNRGILATNGLLHDALIASIRRRSG